MNNKYPNPWNFSNIDKSLLSPNGKYKIQFKELHEIAMGAPITGECYLIYHNKNIKLNNFCGGPIIWNETSDKIALPIWTKQKNQKIAIVNVIDQTITIFKKEFKVLHFNKFINNNLIGIDSPIYLSENFNFNIEEEEVESIIQMK